MMEDVPAFESYIRGRLAFMVKSREERQLLQGAGTGITILGLYNRPASRRSPATASRPSTRS